MIFILKTVYCVCSLESPQGGDSNENTQHTFMLWKIKEILIMPPDLALLSTLTGSNYPCLELFFMVPKVFEPLKFDCKNAQVVKGKVSIVLSEHTQRTVITESCFCYFWLLYWLYCCFTSTVNI